MLYISSNPSSAEQELDFPAWMDGKKHIAIIFVVVKIKYQ